MGDLCAACMCTGRNLYYIGETGFYHLYSQILNEIQVYDSLPFYIRVCWECLAHLRKWCKFKEQAKRSYTQLQYVHQNNFAPAPRPQRLSVSPIYSFSFPEPPIKNEASDPPSPQPAADRQADKQTEVKTEEHCEPETFVHELCVQRDRRRKKVDKPIKEKSKKKMKPKSEKVPVKKKIKVKKKRSLTPELQDDHLATSDLDTEHDVDMNTCDVDMKDDIVDDAETKVEETEKEEPFVEESKRLIGAIKVAKEARLKESLPERPHCEQCGKNFSSRKTYRYHLNVLHKGQNRYPCARCGKVYQWKSNLGRHLRSHKARDSGELYCSTCDKRFASVATYRQHLRVSRQHVPESDFSFMCNECGKKFVNKTRLRDHIDWEHLKKIKFRCQLCNKPFKCHTSLYVHMQNVHRNKEKKDNLCHVCGKSYQNAAKLKYHIVAMHTSETPYQCQQCSAAFGWYSSLYRHVREVHYKMKLQPKKSKKSKKTDILPLLPNQVVLAPMHQPGPP